MPERKGQNIIKRLEYDDIVLEYGVPFQTIPYKLVSSNLIGGDIDEQTSINNAADIVEAEAREGRFGAFVTSQTIEDKILIEVWAWDNEN